MAGIAVVAVALTIVFNNSWWRQTDPIASPQQQFHGESLFTQAGIDYSAKRGLVTVSLAEDRPAASRLGLARSGARTVNYIVPLTVEVSGAGDPVRQTLVDAVRLQTMDGRIAAVSFTDDRSYSDIYQNAVTLIAATGSAADRTAFDSMIASSRKASADRSYDAVSVTTRDGMRTRLEIKGTPSTARLTITLTPA